jgi:hypothetical protein
MPRDRGKVAMLLPMQYDAAKGKVDLFRNPPFECMLTLLKRIQWANLELTASPSSNHSWYVWDWSNEKGTRSGSLSLQSIC